MSELETDKGTQRPYKLTIMLSVEELGWLKALSESEGLNVSTWLRNTVRRMARTVL